MTAWEIQYLGFYAQQKSLVKSIHILYPRWADSEEANPITWLSWKHQTTTHNELSISNLGPNPQEASHIFVLSVEALLVLLNFMTAEILYLPAVLWENISYSFGRKIP